MMSMESVAFQVARKPFVHSAPFCKIAFKKIAGNYSKSCDFVD